MAGLWSIWFLVCLVRLVRRTRAVQAVLAAHVLIFFLDGGRPSTACAEVGFRLIPSPAFSEMAGVVSTACIERPPLYRGGSASKKNGLPAPSHHFATARCASTEDHQAPSLLILATIAGESIVVENCEERGCRL